MKQRFSIHLCALDKEDRQYGAPPHRVHINTPWFHFAFAYRKESRFAGRIDMTKYPEEIVPIGKSRWTTFRWKIKDRS